MPRPRPTKLLLSQVLDLDNLYAAWEEVRASKGAAGGDRITLARFERHLELNLLHLAQRVLDGAYRPGKVRMVTVWAGRKWRSIAVWCVADRVLQRAVLNVLEPTFERLFLPVSFGYRRNRSVAGAVERVLDLRDQGYRFVVDADIRDCFASLDHTLIMGRVRGHVMDQDILDLVQIWLSYGRRRSTRRSQESKGISLGAAVSPLLCNIYLHQLDLALRRHRHQVVRYADDFVVLCDSAERRDDALEVVNHALDSIKLELNTDKTRLTSFAEGFTFLGVTFEGGRYWYEHRGVSLEASGKGESLPVMVDGYW